MRSDKDRKAKILIIEDDTSIRTGLEMNLRLEGHQVIGAGDGEKGLRRALDESPDLIILDLLLPGLCGLDVLEVLRDHKSEIPVIILSARGSKRDKIEGLETGADDYVTKPFDIEELLARVRARLRRVSDSGNSSHRYRFGDIEVDREARTVMRQGQGLHLTAKELDLLLFFIDGANRAWAREQILRHVWGYDYEGTERTVDNFVATLRSKIEDDPSKPCFLRTVRGVGYLFNP